MFSRAWIARSRWVVLVGLLLALAVGCTSLPLEASWASVTLLGNPAQVLVAYADRMVMVDPVDGSVAELRDADGNVRLDEQGNPRTWIVTNSSPKYTFYTRPIEMQEDTLLVAAYESRLLEVDTITARVLNSEGHVLAGHSIASPLQNGSLLYVPLSSNSLDALNLETFETVWSFKTERGVWATPLLHEGVLYVPSMDHTLYALNPTTGEEIWRLDLGGAIAATPVVANGHLYIGSFAKKVFKVSLEGSIVAQYETSEWIWGAPAVVEDQVYVADLAGYVYALRDTGDAFSEIWSRQVALRGIRATPLVTDDYVIVGSRDHNVYWVSRESGEEVNKREMRGEVLADLLLLQPGDGTETREPLVVVSTLAREELLVAFTLVNGERRWVYGL
ncbi:MAG: PQQ-binding-like beta-propeller repeat protein [Anaerolineae bacterium]|nr:PQQ-binding-like beta-propeller repeat protein [Anaerolineae bacterium]NUQ02294.1 PQQ-binding-like beta-propeller repeat protein [Anaerolineae bacterium]